MGNNWKKIEAQQIFLSFLGFQNEVSHDMGKLFFSIYPLYYLKFGRKTPKFLKNYFTLYYPNFNSEFSNAMVSSGGEEGQLDTLYKSPKFRRKICLNQYIFKMEWKVWYD